ncbi:helix-turn-helix transcriptional regulator [Companilactobacillus muriivasis]|uniref:helix-turn-helix transcriptional regulator n=1 Tax=Companilactobacillus muriivasis TaxID=3081444 RepID=UPI0030C70DA1
MDLSDKIKICRKENKMTQEQFAQKLNVSRKTVSGWENGRSFPDIKTLVNISNTFDISLDNLLKEDNTIKHYQTEVANNRKNKKITVILYLFLWMSFILLLIQFLSNFKLPYHVAIISLLIFLIMYVITGPNAHKVNSFKSLFGIFCFFIVVFVINMILFVVTGNLEVDADPYWSMGIIVGALFIDFVLSVSLCILVFLVPDRLLSDFRLLVHSHK